MGSPHDSKGREHPKDGGNEGGGHFMNGGIVGKDLEEVFADRQIQCQADHRKDARKDPRPIDDFFTAPVLPRADILGDHRHGGVLDAHTDLIDHIVDLHADAEGGGGNDADIVDQGVDEQDGKVDTARLDRHRRTEAEDHLGVVTVGTEASPPKIEPEGFPSSVKIEERKKEGDRLTDDSGKRGTRNALIRLIISS